MVQGIYQGIPLTALFWIVESLIILHPLMNYSQKALQRPMTCLLVNNRLCRKLLLSASIMSDDNLRIMLVEFFAAD